MRRLLTLIVLAVLTAATPLRVAADDEASAPLDPLRHTIPLPLKDGDVDLVELLAVTMDQADLPGDLLRKHATTSVRIDVSSFQGRASLVLLERMTSNVLHFERTDAQLKVHVNRLQLRRMSRDIRSQTRALVEQWFPEAAAEASLGYGFRVHTADGAVGVLDDAKLPEHVVVTIHGLDEPGDVFDQFIPFANEHGYVVCNFLYPNDQGIGDSAKLFREHLARVRAAGASRVTIVAHSMGGLVSRQMLTHLKLYGGSGAGDDTHPTVVRLIMVGTPQHGSEMARLRLVIEARDQLARVLSGDGLLFGSVFDGAGEAQIDLLPKSAFLQKLNRRPNPKDVPYTIIAGKASPVTAEGIAAARVALKAALPKEANGEIDDIAESLQSVTEKLGDGVVSLKSSKLAGVDDYTVVARNHLTILHHSGLLRNGDGTALPIILDRLKADAEAGRHEP